MAVHDRAAQTALRLLQKHGRPVSLIKINRTAMDPNKPWRGSENIPDTTVTVTAVFMDPVSEKDLGRELRRGDEENTDNITRGSQICFFAAWENLDSAGAPLDLTNYDRMLDHGVVYTLEEMHVLSPGTTKVMYEARVVR